MLFILKLLLRVVLIALLLVNIQACHLWEKKSENQATVEDIDLKSRNNHSQQEHSIVKIKPLMNNAVKNLYSVAKTQVRQQKYTQALATLKRAYAIQPHSPLVSQFMAEIELRQAHYKQAYYWATIATENSLQSGKICQKSWRLLAVAAEQTGDLLSMNKALQAQESCVHATSERY